ncbi:LysE family translocator [Tropicimonas sp. TH_r6]|uniref:LysE family translocator n=1 Tax=Tropicimonas sp. TH_r6 TaxID=3082085 RepID=UPI002955AA87|nr:LysE family translocator [Tropicimonas sp. TH_r6]MDV7142226.1 LysE family translocator [Tropicimonas sp. TH_r6]
MPVDPLTLLAFIPAGLALNLTPGADMMFCLAQGLRGGPRTALAADAGISLGVFFHTAAAGIGLSALVAAESVLLDVIRWVGVAYLLWLAIGALRSGPVPSSAAAALSPGRAFRQALLINLTNPKVILFVLAFLPQFVDPGHGPILPQFLVFGLLLSLGGLVINGLVGVFAGSLGRRLAQSPRFARGLGWVTAGVFTALAARLALMERS